MIEISKDTKVLYMGGNRYGKRNLFIEHLIDQGVDVKMVENAGEIRGTSFEYVIIDELVKEDLL